MSHVTYFVIHFKICATCATICCIFQRFSHFAPIFTRSRVSVKNAKLPFCYNFGTILLPFCYNITICFIMLPFCYNVTILLQCYHFVIMLPFLLSFCYHVIILDNRDTEREKEKYNTHYFYIFFNIF